MDRAEIRKWLQNRPDLLEAVELQGPKGQAGERKNKKLKEVAGFCEIILRYVRKWQADTDPLRVLESSCGKSYLGLLLKLLLEEVRGQSVKLTGNDVDEELVEKCRQVASEAGVEEARYLAARTLEAAEGETFDLLISLHACDTATDEAIARGIQLEVPLILAVPCCQNQIRGQIKGGGTLEGITQFGPARYRLANLLTDSLRAQFLRSAGYEVQMDEITSPRVTPKNLCICARKIRNPSSSRRDRRYRQLRDFFGVRPAVEKFCPDVLNREESVT